MQSAHIKDTVDLSHESLGQAVRYSIQKEENASACARIAGVGRDRRLGRRLGACILLERIEQLLAQDVLDSAGSKDDGYAHLALRISHERVARLQNRGVTPEPPAMKPIASKGDSLPEGVRRNVVSASGGGFPPRLLGKMSDVLKMDSPRGPLTSRLCQSRPTACRTTAHPYSLTKVFRAGDT